MTYQWKNGLNLYPVSAQVAGDELNRIYRANGVLEPEGVVNISRPEDAPLHPVFEWDNEVAAEKYRVHQAGGLIRAVAVVEQPKKDKPPIEVRAFVHVQQAYHPIEVVTRDVEMREEMLETALKELRAFQRKYTDLQELSPVLKEIARIQAVYADLPEFASIT